MNDLEATLDYIRSQKAVLATAAELMGRASQDRRAATIDRLAKIEAELDLILAKVREVTQGDDASRSW